MSNRKMPENGKEYYRIELDGTITCNTWEGNSTDIGCYALNNCFPTYEKAEFELERRKVLAEMKEFTADKQLTDKHHPHGSLYVIEYDYKLHRICIDYYFDAIAGGVEVFAGNAAVRDCIRKVGADRIKKYYLRLGEKELNQSKDFV